MSVRTVITYGTFDLLHHGHVRLLERARALGDRLIVGVTSDQFDRSRGKLDVAQSTLERVDAVRATGLADLVLIEEYEGQKIEDIRRYGVDVFTVGSDWEGVFDYLREWCEVVYLDRTKGVSSTQMRSRDGRVRLGLVGDVPYLSKFLGEARRIPGIDVVAACAEDVSGLPAELASLRLVTGSLEEMLGSVDAAYLISHPSLHAGQARRCLESGVHVLCEAPLSLSRRAAEELRGLSRETGCLLVEALRTVYAPAYHHLLLLVESGAIGDVVSVDSTCTSLRPVNLGDRGAVSSAWNSICSWGPTAMLPIFQLLGTGYRSKEIASRILDEETRFDGFTRMSFTYDCAVATARVGRGVKSEGELVVSGTRGYAYVPAPWWKTDYFEIRREDPAENRRYFYQLEGEGIRGELVSFVRAVRGAGDVPRMEADVSLAMAGVLEDYYAGVDLVRLR